MVSGLGDQSVAGDGRFRLAVDTSLVRKGHDPVAAGDAGGGCSGTGSVKNSYN